MAGQLRVAVIGSETRHPDKPPLTYTVYRTSVNYQGFCYHRLIRYRRFRSFAKRLELAPNAARISVKFPPKIWWSRKASLQPETVEARQVLLNEFMQEAITRPLTPRSEEQLLKLLQVGAFAPQEEEDRVINGWLSLKQQSASLTEPTSENLDLNHSLQSEPCHHLPGTSDKQPQECLIDDEEGSLCTAVEQVHNVPNSLLVRRQDSRASSEPASNDTEARGDGSVSLPLSLQNTKHVISGSSTEEDLLLLKEGDRDVTGSSFDGALTPDGHYADQIKQCIANIKDIVDNSRKLEVHCHEKQTANRPMEAGTP